jgi:hypothetical protein
LVFPEPASAFLLVEAKESIVRTHSGSVANGGSAASGASTPSDETSGSGAMRSTRAKYRSRASAGGASSSVHSARVRTFVVE